MITVEDKKKCCGCSACLSVCTQNCITMAYDAEGFAYPCVDLDKCKKCRSCIKVCPYNNTKMLEVKESSLCLGVQVKDSTQRKECTSGGFVDLLIRELFEDGVKIFGCLYDKNMDVIHRLAVSNEDLDLFRGSKYVQSNLRRTFSEVKQSIKKGEACFFVGTGCQIRGLKNYIGDSDKLFTVDLLCLGVSSQSLFRGWLSFLEKKYEKKVVNVQFRNKKYGYSVPNVVVVFDDDTLLEQKYDSRVYSKLFFNYYNVRPSCYECKFREEPRCSDITVGDFYDIGQYSQQMDNDTGVTKIWIHSDKGKSIVSRLMPKLNYVQIGGLCSNCVGGKKIKYSCPSDRVNFFEDAKNMSFESLVCKWQPKSVLDDVLGVIRKFICVLPFSSSINKLLVKRRTNRFKKKVERANFRK